MPAPFGNKNGVGKGRPPNPGFSDEELIILGEELLEWMEKVEKEDLRVVHLSQWYSETKAICPTQWDSICRRSCFISYYKRALIWMGKLTLLNKDLPTAYGSRFLGIYFKEVSDKEREVVEHKVDYEIKKKMEHEASRGSVPNDIGLTNLITGLHSIKETENLKAQIAELTAKLNASQPKTDNIIQPSDQTV